MRADNQTRRLVTIALFLFLLGIFIARESTIGFMCRAEKAANSWLMGASKEPEGIEGIVLIQQDDTANGKLSPLDTALFLRAASVLGARVAAITSCDLATGDRSLLDSLLDSPDRLKCATVGSCKLLSQGQSEGLFPATIENYPVDHPVLQSFSTSYSMLPNAAGISGGFSNLPENNRTNQQFMTAAVFNGRIVAALPLQIILEEARMRGVTITDVYENSWKFSNGSHLRFSQNGLATLLPANLKRIVRITLDDLLLAAERREQNVGGSETIDAVVNDRILILGSHGEQPAHPIQFGNGQPLSQPEVIALAIASLQNSMINRTTHWGIQGIVLLIFSLLCAITIKMKPLDAVFALIILLGFYVLMSMAIVSELSVIPPILAPATICIAAFLGRAFFKKSEVGRETQK